MNILKFIAYIQFILVLDKWFVKVYNQNNIIKVYKGKFDENFSERLQFFAGRTGKQACISSARMQLPLQVVLESREYVCDGFRCKKLHC